MPIPPKEVQKAAQRAIDARNSVPPSRKAGTPVGVKRASDLARGANISVNTLVRMRSYLLRAKKAYLDARYKEEDFSVTNQLVEEVISLPMHSELEDDQIEFIAKAVLDYVNQT